MCHQSNNEPSQPTKFHIQSPQTLHAEWRINELPEYKLPSSLQHKIYLPKLRLQPYRQVRACLEEQESPLDHRNAAMFVYSGRSCWSLYIEKDEAKLTSSQMQQLQPVRRFMSIKLFFLLCCLPKPDIHRAKFLYDEMK